MSGYTYRHTHRTLITHTVNNVFSPAETIAQTCSHNAANVAQSLSSNAEGHMNVISL